MTPKQVIDLILYEQNINTNQLAKEIGTTSTNLYDIMSGKIRAITNDMAEKIRAKFPNYSRPWLLTGEGKPHVEDIMPASSDGEDVEAPGSTNVHINGSKTTGDIVKICNAFIGEMAAQREAHSRETAELLSIINNLLKQ